MLCLNINQYYFRLFARSTNCSLENLRCENMIMGKTSKVVVCGTKKCGKTSILEQLIYGKVGVSNIWFGKYNLTEIAINQKLIKSFILQILALFCND